MFALIILAVSYSHVDVYMVSVEYFFGLSLKFYIQLIFIEFKYTLKYRAYCFLAAYIHKCSIHIQLSI